MIVWTLEELIDESGGTRILGVYSSEAALDRALATRIGTLPLASTNFIVDNHEVLD